MTSNQVLVCDNSTLTNFKAWAQAISNFFTTAGWTKSSDTGQVNWSTIASVPGSGAYVYEIWQPNDGITPTFYLKIEYGNYSGSTNAPNIRLTLSSSTDGAGNAIGFLVGPYPCGSGTGGTSATTQYNCYFSGGSSRMSVMMWRDKTDVAYPQFFSVERSLNSSGTYTGTYVTLWTVGYSLAGVSGRQQSLYFGVGAGQLSPSRNDGFNVSGIPVRFVQPWSGSSAFGGSIPFDTASPYVGYWDYPCTTVGIAYAPDIAEGVPFIVTLYGSTRTYMPSKNTPLCSATAFGSTLAALCMRYD